MFLNYIKSIAEQFAFKPIQYVYLQVFSVYFGGWYNIQVHLKCIIKDKYDF